MTHDRRPYDVITVGEVLLEVATESDFRQGLDARLGVSGDALNAAIAASRHGARVALAAVLPDDELGQAIRAAIADFGICTDLLRHRPGQQGVYLVHGDPDGQREFSYARAGSVGSTLNPQDLPVPVLQEAGAVLVSGITAAISATGAETVRHAARHAQRLVFDPNFRPRLGPPEAIAALIQEIATDAYLITPSYPGETSALLGASNPAAAARLLRASGTEYVAVTCGADGVHLEGPDGARWIDAVPAPVVVDQTGAGDVYVGTLTARLVLGDDPLLAARTAAAASSLAVGGRGGSGLVPTLTESVAHADLPPSSKEER